MEPAFRDTKDLRFGMGLSATRIGEPMRRDRLLLLTAKAEPETLALVRPGGWRKATTLTPSLVKDALARRFRDFEAFRIVPTTRGKSGPVRGTGPPGRAAAA
jgi:hypothetical protein